MISTSLFDLFKIGPGPSSSHTVGPMFAANRFRSEVITHIRKHSRKAAETRILVHLYGSLADTGQGHGTDRAVLAGLFGYTPIDVNVDELNQYFHEKGLRYEIPFGQVVIPFSEPDIEFHFGENPYRHPNTLSFELIEGGRVIIESIFYSIGGGFIEEEGVTETLTHSNDPKFHYHNMNAFLHQVRESGLSPIEILYANESAVSDLSREAIDERLDQIIDTMLNCVERGLMSDGILPGGLNLSRRAKDMFQNAVSLESEHAAPSAPFAKMNAYALAVSEENAAGHIVVTAPTNGAAGVIPATLAYLYRDLNTERTLLREGLMIAGLIGFIVKENASISGAELGCQAEVGAAASMAAACFAHVFTGDFKIICNAAEIAMEHHLGMTCDPVKGLVQVPCIERNANGVIKAYNAYILASARSTEPLVSLDQVIETMRQTGLDLSEKYRETSSGGLAVHGWANMPGS